MDRSIVNVLFRGKRPLYIKVYAQAPVTIVWLYKATFVGLIRLRASNKRGRTGLQAVICLTLSLLIQDPELA